MVGRKRSEEKIQVDIGLVRLDINGVKQKRV